MASGPFIMGSAAIAPVAGPARVLFSARSDGQSHLFCTCYEPCYHPDILRAAS